MQEPRLSLARSLRNPLAILVLATSLVLAGGASATPLSQDGLVFVVRAGSSPTGAPLFEVADSSNSSVKKLWDRVSSDPQVKRATTLYEQVQAERKEEIRKELIADGRLSAEDQAILADLPGPRPVYVEVGPGTAGAYNDWKARFTLRTPGGTQETVNAPRIVFQANDPVAIGDRSLFAQTLVHEISHGLHAQLVGPGNTPWTPWLSRSHAGNTTSDGTLALIEGYAEFMAAYLTGRETIASDPSGALTRNLYAYDKDGKVKAAADLWNTEGWAATVMLEVAKSEHIDNGVDKIHRALREENPETFKELLETVQEQNPGDKREIQAIVSEKSLGKIYPGVTRVDPGPVTGNPPVFGGGGGGGGGGSDGSRWDTGKVAKIFAAVAGGVLGATFGVSFGPVGILVAGALGATAGAFLADFLFDRDPSSEAASWDPGHVHRGGSGSMWVNPATYAYPASPVARDPSTAREFLEEAYLAYRDLLGQPGVHPKELEAARQGYEAARSAYDAAFSAAR